VKVEKTIFQKKPMRITNGPRKKIIP
jgi:hypothetical protein